MVKQILASRRVCLGCGLVVDGQALWPRCPHAGDGGEHVMLRELDESRLPFGLAGDPAYPDKPFLRWRHRLHAWHLAEHAGWTDAEFIALVGKLESRIAAIDGHGFRVTPLVDATTLADRLELPGRLLVKDETGNVAGSHKARHLFGLVLAMEALGIGPERLLTIASCGNAALAAAVLAHAARRCLRVFVPTDAPASIVARLHALHASVVVCERTHGEQGDPCMRHFRKSVRDGALPFTCQGPESGLTIDGGETLAWELLAQIGSARIDRLFVQVGGGALGSSVGHALLHAARSCERLRMPRIHAVQTRSAWPLARAYERLARRLDAALGTSGASGSGEAAPFELDQGADALAFRERRAARLAAAWGTDAMQCTLRRAATRRADFMWPWESIPASVAHGILDDETYDWLALTRAMIESGGFPVIVDEATLVRANELGHDTTGIAVDATGTAGLAGLMTLHAAHAIPAGETAVVLFTGARR